MRKTTKLRRTSPVLTYKAPQETTKQEIGAELRDIGGLPSLAADATLAKWRLAARLHLTQRLTTTLSYP